MTTRQITVSLDGLRTNIMYIGALNCCSCKDIGMSDLSRINQQRGGIYSVEKRGR